MMNQEGDGLGFIGHMPGITRLLHGYPRVPPEEGGPARGPSSLKIIT
jgi:hypothetical protein